MSATDRIARYARPCRAPWWARGGHRQTIAAHLLASHAHSPSGHASARRREVPLDDGDRLVVVETPGTSGVRVHLFHGLSGDVDSDYMRLAARDLAALGHGVWAVNHRGCGAGQGLARKPYHSGRSEDLRAVLAASRAEQPRLLRLVIGFSMSGNIGLLHASEDAPLAHGLIAVNPVIDLADASFRISRGASRLYELRFVQRLRRDLCERQRRGLIDGRFDVPRTATLRQFDDLVTAPLGGFRDADDYYERCSSIRTLSRVSIPTVIVASQDDPFLDVGLYASARLSESILLHVESHGGHIGFLGQAGERWLGGALQHYVEELARVARHGEGP